MHAEHGWIFQVDIDFVGKTFTLSVDEVPFFEMPFQATIFHRREFRAIDNGSCTINGKMIMEDKNWMVWSTEAF